MWGVLRVDILLLVLGARSKRENNIMCCCLLLTTALSSSPLTYLSVPKIKEWICLELLSQQKRLFHCSKARLQGAMLIVFGKPKTLAYLHCT